MNKLTFFAVMLMLSPVAIFNASATPLEGELHITGTFTLLEGTSTSSVSTTDLATADGAGFSSSVAYVSVATGDYSEALYAPFIPNSSISHKDFFFYEDGVIDDLWQVTVGSDIYSFDLEGYYSVEQNDNFINILGYGYTYLNDDIDTKTKSSWSFTALGNNNFSFTSSVPGPQTLPLLGMGLVLLLAGLRQKQKA